MKKAISRLILSSTLFCANWAWAGNTMSGANVSKRDFTLSGMSKGLRNFCVFSHFAHRFITKQGISSTEPDKKALRYVMTEPCTTAKMKIKLETKEAEQTLAKMYTEFEKVRSASYSEGDTTFEAIVELAWQFIFDNEKRILALSPTKEETMYSERELKYAYLLLKTQLEELFSKTSSQYEEYVKKTIDEMEVITKINTSLEYQH